MISPIIIIAIATIAAAHGHVTSILAGGQEYSGFLIFTHPYASPPPELIAWSTTATDDGYAQQVPGADVICNRGAKPGKLSAPIAAGDTVTLTWSQWLSDHHGPVVNYLAPCNADCATVDPASLKFFKISETGYENGVWGTDLLIQNGNKWDVVIPANIKAGGYVLRHELIAMQGKFQLYPQCVNLEVTGGGDSVPEGVPGADLYTGNEPGLTTNIWQPVSDYKIPGPGLYDSGAGTDTDTAGSETETVGSTQAVASTTTTTRAHTTFVTSPSPSSSETESQTEPTSETTDDTLEVVPVTPGATDMSTGTSTGTDTSATETGSITQTTCSPTYTLTSTSIETVVTMILDEYKFACTQIL
ncbi:glycosyl hydrolase family 61-domain-containing protein [Aspergillus pseudoustus]|uniref:Glycosyl hydrolase family 61-domain-containing protein n=1 Tax=Aspergillus pseudoustus TaxID=1810923 RepID=A0ABR4IT76_9EURO